MSDADMPRRFPLIAMGFAVVALVFAVVAVVVVLTRDDGTAELQAKASAKPVLAPIVDSTVKATDVVKLHRNGVEVVEAGQTKGLRVKDPALAQSLALEPDDVITSISGRPMTREFDVYEAVFNSGMMGATTLYVEALRGGQPTLLRWRLDGDLRQARYGSTSPGLGTGAYGTGIGGSLGTGGYGYAPPPSLPPDPDPLLDTIVKVDDTHAKVPRKTIDEMLSDPMKFTKGARVVPSVKNGQANGIKLYAIRPSSPYARLNFTNGDTIHAINGHDLSSIDKALEIYEKVKKADELTFDITRRGRPVTLLITITK